MINFIRRLLRALLPSKIFAISSKLADVVSSIRYFGFQQFKILFGKTNRNTPTNEIAVKRLGSKITFRPNSTDVGTIIQTLARAEWGHYILNDVENILDAGAYIGDSALYFADRHPKANIVCLEPNVDNYKLLTLNTRHLGEKITLLQNGLWHTQQSLRFNGAFTSGRLVMSSEESAPLISSVSVASLLTTMNIDRFDIVKLDIEGAELEVLSKENCWLKSTRVLLVEYHGSDIESQCNSVLLKHGFRRRIHRSVSIYTNSGV